LDRSYAGSWLALELEAHQRLQYPEVVILHQKPHVYEAQTRPPLHARLVHTIAEIGRRLLGVGITTINRIETGAVEDPHFSMLRKLARALDVDPRELLED
jgi:hypothetical protein